MINSTVKDSFTVAKGWRKRQIKEHAQQQRKAKIVAQLPEAPL